MGTINNTNPNWGSIVMGSLSVAVVAQLIYGLVKQLPALLLGALIYIPLNTIVEIALIVLGILTINNTDTIADTVRQQAGTQLSDTEVRTAKIGGSAVLAIVGVIIIIIKINVWIPIYKTRKYFLSQRTNTMSMS